MGRHRSGIARRHASRERRGALRLRRGSVERFARRFATTELVCALAIATIAAAASLLGIEAFSVQSGSMRPAIPEGALALVSTGEDPLSLEAGDVVAYRATGVGGSDGSIVLHRVVENDRTLGFVTTKGDANTAPDPAPTSYEAVVGRCVAVVPGAGLPAATLSEYRRHTAVALAAVNLVVVCAAAREIVVRRRRRARVPF